MAGGGGGKSTTTEHKEIRLPPWVEQASQENYGFAKEIADRPWAYYPGQTIAPVDKLTGKARNLQSSLDDYQANYGTAEAALKGLLSYNPADIKASTVSAEMLPNMDRAAYTNPWINDVENNAISNATRAGLGEQQRIASEATNKGAFGGSRFALQQAVQGAETARKVGDISAELRKAGYDEATAAMTADANRKLTADTQTGTWAQEAQVESRRQDIQAKQLSAEAAQRMSDIATAAQQSRMNQIATLLGIGNIYQQQRQRVLDASRAKWEDRRNYPLQQLNIRLAALGMSPYGHTEDSTSTTKQSGGGGGLGQALGMGGSLLQMFAGLSDEETKTDIEEVGQHPILPVKLYAYRYKKDPKRYPKVIGPMAQDVERVAPHLVRKIGKRRVVDMRALAV